MVSIGGTQNDEKVTYSALKKEPLQKFGVGNFMRSSDLMRQCHKIFDFKFFHVTTSPGPA